MLKHPAVADAAVFGVPEKRCDEAVRAAVVTEEESSVFEVELIAWLPTGLAAIKAPEAIDFRTQRRRVAPGSSCGTVRIHIARTGRGGSLAGVAALPRRLGLTMGAGGKGSR
jgi:acyl-CoA synthetase (AMP-forming)/AMP-acid ligase II